MLKQNREKNGRCISNSHNQPFARTSACFTHSSNPIHHSSVYLEVDGERVRSASQSERFEGGDVEEGPKDARVAITDQQMSQKQAILNNQTDTEKSNQKYLNASPKREPTANEIVSTGSNNDKEVKTPIKGAGSHLKDKEAATIQAESGHHQPVSHNAQQSSHSAHPSRSHPQSKSHH